MFPKLLATIEINYDAILGSIGFVLIKAIPIITAIGVFILKNHEKILAFLMSFKKRKIDKIKEQRELEYLEDIDLTNLEKIEKRIDIEARIIGKLADKEEDKLRFEKASLARKEVSMKRKELESRINAEIDVSVVDKTPDNVRQIR